MSAGWLLVVLGLVIALLWSALVGVILILVGLALVVAPGRV